MQFVFGVQARDKADAQAIIKRVVDDETNTGAVDMSDSAHGGLKTFSVRPRLQIDPGRKRDLN